MKSFYRNNSGFSLVEMMVVLVIIGLMTSVVVLVLPSPASEKLARLTEFRNALTAVSRDSVISGQMRALYFTSRGYRVLAVREGRWEAVTNEQAPGWEVPELVALTVEGAEIDLVSDTGVLKPHIWFLPTGEQPDFKISFNFGGVAASVTGGPNGVEVQHEG